MQLQLWPVWGLRRQNFASRDEPVHISCTLCCVCVIKRLKDPSHHIQNWYADDSSCLGRLLRIKEWFLSLLEQGPAFGYFAEPSKSIVIVQPHHGEAAKTIFGNLNVQVTTSGRFLGSYIRDPEGVSSFVRSRVSDWVDGVNCLAKAAKAYPQSAHSAFTRSLSCEWTYLQRVLEGNETEYTPLRDTIRHVFAPSLLGREVLDVEQDLLPFQPKWEVSAWPIPLRQPLMLMPHRSAPLRFCRLPFAPVHRSTWLTTSASAVKSPARSAVLETCR